MWKSEQQCPVGSHAVAGEAASNDWCAVAIPFPIAGRASKGDSHPDGGKRPSVRHPIAVRLLPGNPTVTYDPSPR